MFETTKELMVARIKHCEQNVGLYKTWAKIAHHDPRYEMTWVNSTTWELKFEYEDGWKLIARRGD